VRKTRRGFTLFELALTMAVIAIAAGVAVPSVRSLFGNSRLTASADMVKARWADARAHAREEGRPYRFAIRDGTGDFRVAPDGAEFWDGSGGSSGGNGQQPSIIEGSLPKEVRFTSGGDQSSAQGHATQGNSGDWVNPIVFLPDGTARQDATIAFVEEGHGRPLYLRLQGATGAATTSSNPDGAAQ
jgi:prepilin-type N-terminal cleavage/methylation domain-containing protein